MDVRWSPVPRHNPYLLVVDDDPTAVTAATALEEASFAVELVGTAQALQFVNHARTPPSLVLLGIGSGFEGEVLAHQIRRRGDSNFPVIVMSSLGAVERQAVGRRIGASSHIGKPVDVEHLLWLVRELVRPWGQTSSQGHMPPSAAIPDHDQSNGLEIS